MPVGLRQRPRQYRTVWPGPRVAGAHRRDTTAQFGKYVTGLRVAAGRDVAGEAEQRLTCRVGAVGDQPRGSTHTVHVEPLAVPAQYLTIDGGHGETDPFCEIAGEIRVVVNERGVSLAQCPDRASQPVGVGAVRWVRVVLRGWAGVEAAIRLHPQHNIAGVAP